jgi:hypothetical protein
LPLLQARRIAEVATYLTDHAFPWLPVCQWILSVPEDGRARKEGLKEDGYRRKPMDEGIPEASIPGRGACGQPQPTNGSGGRWPV